MIDQRLAPLDGLRGLAILFVLIWHFSNLVDPLSGPIAYLFVAASRLCWSGVDLFFVLSGFLIGGILIDNKEASNLWRVFYLRRSLRILPIYFLMLLGFIALLYFRADFQWLLSDPLAIWSYATFTQNFAMAAHSGFGPHFFGITWSLAVEEQFYLILPVMVRFLSPHNLRRAVIALIVGAEFFRIGAFYTMGSLASFVLMPGRSDALFVGVLCAMVYRSPKAMKVLASGTGWFRWLGVLILSVLLVFAYNNSFPISRTMLFGGIAVLAVFYGIILLSALTDAKGPINFICNRWPLRRLGAIAYGTYLFHEAALGLMHGILLHQDPRIASMTDLIVSLASYAAALLIAQMSWTFFEAPLTRLGRSVGYVTKTHTLPSAYLSRKRMDIEREQERRAGVQSSSSWLKGR